jgi:cytochrome c
MKRLILVFIGVLCFALATGARASEQGTADEAVAMVKKAIAFYKENGKDKTIAAVNSKQAQFVDRDLYIVIFDMQGKNLAHGVNPRMIGKDLIDIKDADNKPYMRERIDLIKSKGKGWQDYKFTNPVSQKIEPKSMYVERYEDLIFGCGIYKK